MNDCDVEDTRQPKEAPTHSECANCHKSFYLDDLNFVTLLGLRFYYCDECLEIIEQEQRDD